MAKITGSTNHSIKRVALIEEKVNRSGQEKPSLLQAEMEEELVDEIQISVMTKEVNYSSGFHGRCQMSRC